MASPRSRTARNSGTGCRLMISPISSLGRPPAENLQSSQVTTAKRWSSWFLGSWNVRSLLDCDSAVETARQRSEAGQSDDRQIDQVMRELSRYRIHVAALQETKWYGEAVYRVGDAIVLAAGRPTPPVGESRQRGEGVAITLSGPAVKAWRAGGEQWKAWNLRLVTGPTQTVSTFSLAMHQLSQPVEPIKTDSWMTYNKHWMSYHQTSAMWSWAISTHVWDPELVWTIHGRRSMDLMVWERSMMLGVNCSVVF